MYARVVRAFWSAVRQNIIIEHRACSGVSASYKTIMVLIIRGYMMQEREAETFFFKIVSSALVLSCETRGTLLNRCSRVTHVYYIDLIIILVFRLTVRR